MNPRPFAPEANALPDCATLRYVQKTYETLYSFDGRKSTGRMLQVLCDFENVGHKFRVKNLFKNGNHFVPNLVAFN